MTENKVDLEFISGVGHSGTTVLGMIQGTQENKFFISEWKRLTWINDKHCYCGRSPSECVYWGEVNAVDWCSLLQRAKEIKGESVDTLVDSSKDLYSLRLREQHPRLNVSVTHLVRSPWKNMKKYGVSHLFMWLRTHLTTILFCYWKDIHRKTVFYKEIAGFHGTKTDEKTQRERYHFYTGNEKVRKNYDGIRKP